MSQGSDRELLVGVMAVQLGFASSGQVMSTAAEWATDRTRSISELMEQRGILTAKQREMIDALAAQAIQVNQGDVKRTLTSLGGDRVLQSLGGSLLAPTLPRPVSASDDYDEQTDPYRNSEEDLLAVSVEDVGRYTDPDGKEPTEIGRGGIGRILIARDHFIHRDVAIKELLPSVTSGGGAPLSGGRSSGKAAPAMQRFLREARVTGALEHPNIVPIYELGRRKDGTLYYTMKLVRGRTMADALAAAKTLPNRLALLPHFLGICNALAYAHSRGVIHRDIKPQNVMVGEFGETVVLDWGLAKVRGRSDLGRGVLKKELVELSGATSIEGSAIGTPSYMSPEQAEGKVDDIDERSDVWALGAMLYEVLTGRPPYEGVNPFDVIGKLLQNPVKPVHEVAPDAPIELTAVAEKALQRDKGLRYQSAGEFARDVEAWLAGRRVGAHEYSSVELLKRFARKNRVTLGIGAAAMTAVLVTAFGGYREVTQERDAAKHFARLMLTDVSKELQQFPGAAPLLEKLSTSALGYYRQSIDPHSAPLDERLELGDAYARIGEVAYGMGKNKEALDAASFAVELFRKALAERPGSPDVQRRLANALIREGDVHTANNDWAKARAALMAALAEVEPAVKAEPGNLEGIDTLSRGYSRVGWLSQREGKLPDAVSWMERALANDQAATALQQANPQEYDRALAADHGMLGELCIEAGELGKAQGYLKEAVRIGEKLAVANPDHKSYQLNLAIDRIGLAKVSRFNGDDVLYSEQASKAGAALKALLAIDQSHRTLAVWQAYQLLTRDWAGAMETLARSAALEATPSGRPDADLVHLSLLAGEPRRAIEAGKKVQPTLAADFTRTAPLVMFAAASAVEGELVQARQLARAALESAREHGGVAMDWPPGEVVLPEVTGSRADAVRRLFDDLAAMKGKRDREGWAKAVDAFARALEQTP